MSLRVNIQSRITRIIGAFTLTLSLVSVVNAQGYDFGRFLSGGGGGQDPQKRRVAQQAGAYVCLGISPGAEKNTVRFTIWSKIPQPHSRIGAIAFDVGRHAGLFRSVAVAMASRGVKPSIIPAQPHPFLRGLTPEYWIHVPQRGHLAPEGLSPGRLVMISATLASGKTINDVLSALHEGLNPATEASGFRVGVVILYLLGGPPPGVATIQDDGGFVITRQSAVCR